MEYSDLVAHLVEGAERHEPLLLPLVDCFLSANPVGALRRHRRVYQLISFLVIFSLHELGVEVLRNFANVGRVYQSYEVADRLLGISSCLLTFSV